MARRSILKPLLSGGDRRSIAQSNRARKILRASPESVEDLVRLIKTDLKTQDGAVANERASEPTRAERGSRGPRERACRGVRGAKPLGVINDDWLVSMRALDLLEKLAHEQPERVQPYKKLFIGPLAESDKWEIRLQIVRALPLLRWTPRERARVIEILRSNVDYPQTFVRAWALDSLATFAENDRALLRTVKRHLTEFERSESKALQARGRKIRARLNPASGSPTT